MPPLQALVHQLMVSTVLNTNIERFRDYNYKAIGQDAKLIIIIIITALALLINPKLPYPKSFAAQDNGTINVGA